MGKQDLLQKIPERKRSRFSAFLISQFYHWEKENNRIAYQVRKKCEKEKKILMERNQKLQNEIDALKSKLVASEERESKLEKELINAMNLVRGRVQNLKKENDALKEQAKKKIDDDDAPQSAPAKKRLAKRKAKGGSLQLRPKQDQVMNSNSNSIPSVEKISSVPPPTLGKLDQQSYGEPPERECRGSRRELDEEGGTKSSAVEVGGADSPKAEKLGKNQRKKLMRATREKKEREKVGVRARDGEEEASPNVCEESGKG